MPTQIKWHQRLHYEDGSVATGNSAWDLAAGEGLVPCSCTWDTAAQLIRELNGRDRTDVFLGYLGDECMDRQLSVSGGNVGRYLVVVQEPGRYFYLTRQLDLVESKELVEVMVGGLPSFYPPVLVQPLTTALGAAEHYFRTGRRARKLPWMQGDVAECLRRGEGNE